MDLKKMIRLLELNLSGSMTKKFIFWILVYVIGYLKFDVRWVLFTVAAYYLCNTWLQSKKTRELPKEEEAVDNKTVAGVLPAWVLHPDMHRVEWANMIINQIWPHVNQYLIDLLKKIEDDPTVKERLKGYQIKYLKFPMASLGKIAPRITGIKVHNSVHRDEIIMDIGVQYSGDLSIKMNVAVDSSMSFLPEASVSLKNFSLTSSGLRVHLRPLLPDIPFVGGVTISFLEVPEVDFDLGGIGAAFDIPGVNFLLRHVIQDQLEQTVVMPHSMTIEIAADTNKHRKPTTLGLTDQKFKSPILKSLPVGVLNIHIVEASDLVNKDVGFSNKSDPYTNVEIRADGETHKFKTEVIYDCLNPKWKMMVDLPIDNPDTIDNIDFAVFDSDKYDKDDPLGKCSIQSEVIRKSRETKKVQDIWKKLDGVRHGSLHVQIGWSELALERTQGEDRSLCTYHQAVLVVIVDSCSNVLGGRNGMKLPNPRVKVEVCGIVQYTETVIGNIDPVFAHRMCFLVTDPQSENVILTVEDDRRNQEVLGTLRLDISDLLERPSLTMVNHRFSLTSKLMRGSESPEVVLTLALRFIKRPKISEFKTENSLRELQKIMLSTLKSSDIADFSINVDRSTSTGAGSTDTVDGKGGLSNGYVKQITTKPPINAVKKKVDSTLTQSTLSSDIEKKSVRQGTQPEIVVGDAEVERSKLHESKSESLIQDSTIAEFSWEKKKPSTPPKTHTLPSALSELAMKSEEAREFVRQNRAPPRDTPKPKIHLSLKYNRGTKTLSVVVHKIKNLTETQHTSIPSSYVKIRIIEPADRPDTNRRLPNTKRKTKTQKETATPVFEETLEYFLLEDDLKHRRLEVTVGHDSRLSMLGFNRVLGRCLVSLDGVANSITCSGKKMKGQL